MIDGNWEDNLRMNKWSNTVKQPDGWGDAGQIDITDRSWRPPQYQNQIQG